MKSDNYKITQYSVSSILGYVENSQIAIPEIQRPFVWKGESDCTYGCTSWERSIR